MPCLFPLLSYFLINVVWKDLRWELEFWTFQTKFIPKNCWDSAVNQIFLLFLWNMHCFGEFRGFIGVFLVLFWFWGFNLFFDYLFFFFQDNTILLHLTCKRSFFWKKKILTSLPSYRNLNVHSLLNLFCHFFNFKLIRIDEAYREQINTLLLPISQIVLQHIIKTYPKWFFAIARCNLLNSGNT